MRYKLGGLIPLVRYVMSVPKRYRYNAFLRQATLHSIIADLERVRDNNDGFWKTTDNLGSGYDTRYRHISWMDTI